MMTSDMARSGERGIALIVVLFMVLILSVLGSSLMFVSRTETLSSLNYKTMSQARYGAESGVHGAVNHLLWQYTPPGTNPADPVAAYDMTKSPVEYNGAPVVLSSDASYATHYPPLSTVTTAFVAAAQGTLGVSVGSIGYTARARLLAMRTIDHPFIPGSKITLQRWEVTGTGRVPGAGSADVEVSAIVERPAVPVFTYAAFATDSGCSALNFGGGAATGSYDSSQYAGSGVPVIAATDGNVGTNGNLDGIGNTTTVNGTLSTPRTGVGTCASGVVNAATLIGGATISGGLVQLPQTVTFPSPPLPSPMPPWGSNVMMNNACPPQTLAYCTSGPSGVVLDPSLVGGTVVLADLSIQGGTHVTFKPGIYNINSITATGNSTLAVDPVAAAAGGAVTFNVAGTNQTTPINLTGGIVGNSTYDPKMMRFLYAGPGNVKLTGGASASALVYAPNATMSFSGGSTFYGAVVGGRITDMGGTSINYDRRLDATALMEGPPVLSAFTWKSF
jgi:hypothetical protein